jgi:hypothetical protein
LQSVLAISKRIEQVDLPQALQGNLREFGGRAFETKIPIDNQLETREPGANTPGGHAYEALAGEVLADVQSRVDSQERAEVTSHARAHGRE